MSEHLLVVDARLHRFKGAIAIGHRSIWHAIGEVTSAQHADETVLLFLHDLDVFRQIVAVFRTDCVRMKVNVTVI